MSSTHVFNVEMTCEGCSGAIERILNRLKGSTVEDFNINLAEKRVKVKSSLPSEEILEILKKSGKATTFVETE